MNADKLKAKMSETIISSAPAAFSNEYLSDELGSFSSWRRRYATMINMTPMNPARSNTWKLMISPPRLRGGLNLAFLRLITTTAILDVPKVDPSFVMSLFVCSLKEHIAFGQVFASRTRQEIVIRVNTLIS